jgi:hypothetical protein
MSVQIKLRRDTSANWTANNPILANGEPGLETDTLKVKYGNGTTAWRELSYAGSTYVLPTATVGTPSTGTLGGVKVDGTTITISNGVISGATTYSLPTATTSILGGVKVDGTTITISNGVITSNYTNYTLPIASNNTLGGVKVDGTTITVNPTTGVISGTAPYTLPIATTNTIGGVRPDGSTITINAGTGVISATTTGVKTRTTATVTTNSLAAGAAVNATITSGFKTYALLSITTSAAAWVTVYTSTAARTADATRLITTDPTPGSGVIAEVITTAAGTQIFSPAVIGFSGESVPSTDISIKVQNQSQSTQTITVILNLLQLEA